MRCVSIREKWAAKRLAMIAWIVSLVLVVVGSGLAEVYVYGDVDGVWAENRSPYIVVGDINISEGYTLTIEPGVEVRFAGPWSLSVRGRLNAVGGNDEERRITIYGTPTVEWRGIFFYPEADARSQIINCDIRDAHIGIDLNRAYTVIRGCRIEARYVAINCLGTTPEISHNLLIRAYDPVSLYDVKAVSIRSGSAPVIYGNQLIEAVALGGGEAYGVYVSESSPVVRENWIEAISDFRANAVFVSRAEKMDLYHNIIRTRSNGIMRGIWAVQSSGVRLVNNTIHLTVSCNNAVGVLADRGAEVTLINNIIVGNGISIGDSTVYGQVHRSSGWNAYWGHERLHVGEWNGGEGEVRADPYFENLSIDREEADYHLRWDEYPEGRRSPCIDAGNPQMEDPDGTRSDIGRFYYHHEPDRVGYAPVVKGREIVTFYPNPFNNALTVQFHSAGSTPISVRIYDLRGREVARLMEGLEIRGEEVLIWRPAQLTGGTYILTLNTPVRTFSYPIIYLP